MYSLLTSVNTHLWKYTFQFLYQQRVYWHEKLTLFFNFTTDYIEGKKQIMASGKFSTTELLDKVWLKLSIDNSQCLQLYIRTDCCYVLVCPLCLLRDQQYLAAIAQNSWYVNCTRLNLAKPMFHSKMYMMLRNRPFAANLLCDCTGQQKVSTVFILLLVQKELGLLLITYTMLLLLLANFLPMKSTKTFVCSPDLTVKQHRFVHRNLHCIYTLFG